MLPHCADLPTSLPRLMTDEGIPGSSGSRRRTNGSEAEELSKSYAK
jgi:hypothetical protein